MDIYCTECQTRKDEKEFYSRFVKDDTFDVTEHKVVVATIHDTNAKGICKECLIEKFTHTYKLFNNNFERTLKVMCEDYNLPFVVSLISLHNDVNYIERLKLYIKDISSLPQYKNMTYFVQKEKSDIDFLNDDIKGVKEHIEYSLKQGSVNEHNKWLNSLREALELKDKLENSNKWEESFLLYQENGKDMIITCEQKGDEIRNTRKYEVKEIPPSVAVKVELDKNYTIDGDTLTIPRKVNGEYCNIYCKRIDNEWVLESGTTIKCN